MPTTLLASNSPIGIGIMGLELAKHLDSIDNVILVDYDWFNEEEKLIFPPEKVVGRVNYKQARAVLKKTMLDFARDPERKMLYVESSWGVSKHFPRDRNFVIPMWEQRSVEVEARYCANLLSVTKYGQLSMLAKGISSRYLPFPVETQKRKELNRVKTILHNAGSYGGGFRKGTPEAIQIFQDSRLAEEGISLVVTALNAPDEHLREIISKGPKGINIEIGFKPSWQELYSNADLLLYPSRVEGHALPVLEANSFGIPALATNFGPINEYDRSEAFSLDVSKILAGRAQVDVPKAAEKLRRIALDGVEAKSIQLHKLVSELYSWEILAPVYNAILS